MADNLLFTKLDSGVCSIQGIWIYLQSYLNEFLLWQPNALASVIWFDVIEDQIDKAIKDFEAYLPLAEPWIAKERARIDKIWLVSVAEKNAVINHYHYQISNCKSNVALAFLAKGNESKAMELWNEAAFISLNQIQDLQLGYWEIHSQRRNCSR